MHTSGWGTQPDEPVEELELDELELDELEVAVEELELAEVPLLEVEVEVDVEVELEDDREVVEPVEEAVVAEVLPIVLAVVLPVEAAELEATVPEELVEAVVEAEPVAAPKACEVPVELTLPPLFPLPETDEGAWAVEVPQAARKRRRAGRSKRMLRTLPAMTARSILPTCAGPHPEAKDTCTALKPDVAAGKPSAANAKLLSSASTSGEAGVLAPGWRALA